MFGFEGTKTIMVVYLYSWKIVVILDSSMVEHSAVNRVVVGSSPTRGVDVRHTATGEKPVVSGKFVM